MTSLYHSELFGVDFGDSLRSVKHFGRLQASDLPAQSRLVADGRALPEETRNTHLRRFDNDEEDSDDCEYEHQDVAGGLDAIVYPLCRLHGVEHVGSTGLSKAVTKAND